MKKRLSKLALLAVAAAFVLVGFPACGDDDDGEEPEAKASATFAGVEIPEGGLALTTGEAKPVTATLKVTNAAFTSAVKDLEADAEIGNLITVAADDEKVAISDVKVREKATDNTVSITFTVTAESGAAKEGEIKATINEAALASAQKLPAMGAISYTVTQATVAEKTAKATLTTGNGVSLTSGEAKAATATVTLTDATFIETITKENFVAKADDGVTVEVTGATRTSDTEATLTLSMKAEANAADGAVSVTIKADALAERDDDLNAEGTISYTVSEPGEMTAALECDIGELVKDVAKEVTATVTLTNGTFAVAIAPANFEATASDDNVSVTVTKVEKKSDTEATLTLSVKAAEGAATGTITVTVNAGAVTNSAKDLTTPGAGYTVKQEQTQPKPPVEEKDPTATLAGTAITVTAGGEAGTATATVTLANGTFAATIAPTNFAATASNDNVSVTVTGATRTSDTVATLTLSVTAKEDATAGNGTISVTVNADAMKDYDNAVKATGTVTYTVKEAEKPEEPVYFESFVASEFGDANSTDTQLTSADGLVTTGTRNAYQINQPYQTNDYNEEAKTGYSYTARIKIKTSQTGKPGTLTITHVKVGDILRIDGGNGSNNGDVRKMGITGADETEWESTVHGSFYLTATADTIVLESMTNEFNIYGIHVVDKKVDESIVGEPKMAYEKPTLTLSATSVVNGDEVTATVTIPDATKTTTYSTGRVTSETVPVNAAITYSGATVTDGKVDTSAEGTLTITASYTIDGNEYKSEAVTLEVTGSFEEQETTVANNDDTLGLTATDATSADESVATAALDNTKANIVITSKKAGTTTITASDGTNSAKINVTVKANGEIETVVRKYPVIETITWALTDKDHLSGVSTLAGLDVGSVEGYASNTKVSAWADEKSKFKYDGDSSYTSVATFTTSLKTNASDCISNGNYAQIVITNNTDKGITLSELEYTHSIKDKPGSGTGTFGCQAFYWIGAATGKGTALTTSTYTEQTSAILTKAKVTFAEDTVVAAGQSVTIRFAYYGGNNSNKVCALKDVVLSVK